MLKKYTSLSLAVITISWSVTVFSNQSSWQQSCRPLMEGLSTAQTDRTGGLVISSSLEFALSNAFQNYLRNNANATAEQVVAASVNCAIETGGADVRMLAGEASALQEVKEEAKVAITRTRNSISEGSYPVTIRHPRADGSRVTKSLNNVEEASALLEELNGTHQKLSDSVQMKQLELQTGMAKQEKVTQAGFSLMKLQMEQAQSIVEKSRP